MPPGRFCFPSSSCVPSVAWLVAFLALGFLSGALWGLSRLGEQTSLSLRPDARPGIAVVRLEGIRDGALSGTMSGDVRLFAGADLVLPAASGAFRITDRSLLTNIVTVRAPEGMRFVASRRGEKYYPVGSPEGDRLAPENRIYFRDGAAAESAGYARGE